MSREVTCRANRNTSFPSLFGSHLTLLGVLVSLAMGVETAGAEADRAQLDQQFTEQVQPFVRKYCLECHGTAKQEGKLDLSNETSVAIVIRNHATWEILAERLEASEMPPAEATTQPSREERNSVLAWIKALREDEAKRHAGDPGIVLAHRLSHAEFDYTIHDLTGVDIRPTRDFPVDPANEAGFDNSGESLMMSPALVMKYLAAARLVADHLVFKPDGVEFAPHSVVTETDRDKYCVHRIVDFYQRHSVDIADYLFASWRYRNRGARGQADAPLSSFAAPILPAGQPLSQKYLAIVWSALNEPVTLGPLAEIQSDWQRLPDNAGSERVRIECQRLRDKIIAKRKELNTGIEKLHVKGQSDGSQPLILWWNRQIADQRMSYRGDGKDPDLDLARERFCRVFPNAFAVSSRGHYADQKLGAEVRLLTAGFHLMQGYFRDDRPLRELVLDQVEQEELDSMWRDLIYVTQVPLRQYKDFLFFERAEPPRFAGGPEFDFARPEDKDATSEVKLDRMRNAYLRKARSQDASDAAIAAINAYFDQISQESRQIESMRIVAQPTHLRWLLRFAERAYRRPLAEAEQQDLTSYYRQLSGDSAQSHEDAVRDCVTSVLLSPHFLYRFDRQSDKSGIQPLTNFELANRLSYFLWSSLPDEELLAQARAGALVRPGVLAAQAERMLRDARIRRLGVEFLGNWLEFRRFEEFNGVDRERFPAFTHELRAAMFEEPIRFFVDLVQRDGSVLDFIEADHTFVNPALARHYGIPVTSAARSSDDSWWRVESANQFGRGGLLPMSVFLTKSSPGLRTSPVKRGYWVVRRMLGEHIPAPPPNVPELPADEATPGEQTLAQVLARHRDHEACAGCHQRFDSIGLIFEGYGPVGERRVKDLGGRAIETAATFPDGRQAEGVEGLRAYLLEKRRDEFVDNFSRKLLSYALGRGLMLSDQPTIDQIRSELADNGNRFGTIIRLVVTSPQFLQKRGREQDSQ